MWVRLPPRAPVFPPLSPPRQYTLTTCETYHLRDIVRPLPDLGHARHPDPPRISPRRLWNFSRLNVTSMSAQPCRLLSDDELAAQFRQTGDSECFAEIFARHRSVVFSACKRFFGNAGKAEDAVQETFLRAYQAIHKFQEGNLRSWLLSIARNVCIDAWRKHRPESKYEEIAAVNPPEPVSFAHRMEMHRALEMVRTELQSLSPEQRRCLEMKMDGYSYQETAERTGISVGDVKSHLQNGRRMLWQRVRGVLSQLP